MPHILIVDDDVGMRAIVSDALRQEGYEVDSVCNGRQALTAFGQHRPDALVLDLSMPVMDGPALVRTLRDQTRWGSVPLIVVSGEPQAQAAGARLGARACLTKPFDLPELLETVEAITPPEPPVA